MSSSAPFMFDRNSLSYQRAIDILKNHDRYASSLYPLVKPKGGEMFLVSTGGDDAKLKNWACDQYSWPVRDGHTSFPR